MIGKKYKYSLTVSYWACYLCSNAYSHNVHHDQSIWHTNRHWTTIRIFFWFYRYVSDEVDWETTKLIGKTCSKSYLRHYCPDFNSKTCGFSRPKLVGNSLSVVLFDKNWSYDKINWCCIWVIAFLSQEIALVISFSINNDRSLILTNAM